MKKTANIFHYKHALGQNFIEDESLLTQLAEASLAGPEDVVLEIGPGMGALTRHLCDRAQTVLAIEIDESLRPFLEAALSGRKNVEVVFADVMRTNLATLIQERFGDAPFRVAANLPYYITTDVLTKVVRELPEAESIAVMVQKEVGEKLLSSPGEEGYGPLALLCRWRYDVQKAIDVPAACFTPKPKVDSCFIRLIRRECPPFAVQDETALLKLFRAGFRMRRKTLLNNLLSAYSADRRTIEEALMAAGLEGTIRAEAVDLAGFCRLCDALGEHVNQDRERTARPQEET